MDQSSNQADNEVADGGEYLRAVSLSDLGAILVEGDVADPVETVLDTPMATVEGEQAFWSGLLGGEVGDDVLPLKALLAGLNRGDVALDQAGLADVREV